MAPEIMMHGRISKAADVYAVRPQPAYNTARVYLFVCLLVARIRVWAMIRPIKCKHTHTRTHTTQFGVLLWELLSAKHAFKGVPRALLGHQVRALHLIT